MTYDPRAPFGHLNREPTQPAPPLPPPPPAPRRSRGAPVLLAVVLVATAIGGGIVGAVAFGGGGSDDDAPAARPAARSSERPRATTTTERDYREPVPEDFSLSVVTLSKQCFGSAGCNVTYDVELTYNAFEQLDPSVTYQVIYEVRGGEDGPQINNLEITGTSYEYESEELISTASSEAALTAVVTTVREIG